MPLKPTIALMIVLSLGCSQTQHEQKTKKTEADHIEVQHILIGFYGSLPGQSLNRPQSEAEALAKQVFEQARQGANFDSLVRQYSNDVYPGRYKLANAGVTPGEGEYARGMMVSGFGDVAFQLDAGEIGMAAYHPEKSKYGWHIIKRLQ